MLLTNIFFKSKSAGYVSACICAVFLISHAHAVCRALLDISSVRECLFFGVCFKTVWRVTLRRVMTCM